MRDGQLLLLITFGINVLRCNNYLFKNMKHPCFSEILERFFPKTESKLIAFVSENPGELWRTAIEDCDLPFLFVLKLLEHLIPIWTTCVRSSFQTSDEVSFLLINKK